MYKKVVQGSGCGLIWGTVRREWVKPKRAAAFMIQSVWIEVWTQDFWIMKQCYQPVHHVLCFNPLRPISCDCSTGFDTQIWISEQTANIFGYCSKLFHFWHSLRRRRTRRRRRRRRRWRRCYLRTPSVPHLLSAANPFVGTAFPYKIVQHVWFSRESGEGRGG